MDVSNISNWGSLTASQILEYENEGADVPDEYVAWAEQVGGDSTQTFDQTATVLTSTANQVNEASQFRDELVQQGVSLKDLASIFTDESTLQQEKLEAAEATLQGLAAQSQATSATISAATASTQSTVSNLESQLAAANASVANASTDEEASAAQAEATAISGEISETASTATQTSTAQVSKLTTIGEKILNVFDMSIDSKEIGDETIKIATELNGKVAKNAAKQTAISAGIGAALGTAAAFGAAALGIISGGLAIAGVALLGAGIGALINLFSGKGKNYEEAKAAYDAGSELDAVAVKAKAEAQTAATANNITIQEAQSAQTVDTTSTTVDAGPNVNNKTDETSTKKKG